MGVSKSKLKKNGIVLNKSKQLNILKNLDDEEQLNKMKKPEKLNTKARVIKVYDGDTIFISYFHHGFLYSNKLRIVGVDCPEIRPEKKGRTEESLIREKAISAKIRDILKEKILDKIVDIEIIRGEDKYGRDLGDAFIEGESISKWLLENNYGYNYEGDGKKSFDELDKEGFYDWFKN